MLFSNKEFKEAEERVKNATNEAIQLAFDAIYDYALQEVLLSLDFVKEKSNATS